ncbi:unnamed protein product, partial [Iphiclides podalirius]
MEIELDVHEALKPISWLSGHWVTEHGRGVFPNLKEFEYQENLEFICVGQPIFNFLSMSHHPEKGTPMHQERGFLRINPGTNELAFIVSHNFGLSSVEEGHFDPEKKEIKLATVNISRTSFAKPPYLSEMNPMNETWSREEHIGYWAHVASERWKKKGWSGIGDGTHNVVERILPASYSNEDYEVVSR